MTFEQQILLTILDKGLLAAVLALVAGLVNWWLQRDKAQKDLIKEIATFRATAYATFWKKTEPFRETDPPPLTEDVRKTGGWSSSSAIRLSPSQIRTCGFPAYGSSQG
jgi:hypothetical protein